MKLGQLHLTGAFSKKYFKHEKAPVLKRYLVDKGRVYPAILQEYNFLLPVFTLLSQDTETSFTINIYQYLHFLPIVKSK